MCIPGEQTHLERRTLMTRVRSRHAFSWDISETQNSRQLYENINWIFFNIYYWECSKWNTRAINEIFPFSRNISHWCSCYCTWLSAIFRHLWLGKNIFYFLFFCGGPHSKALWTDIKTQFTVWVSAFMVKTLGEAEKDKILRVTQKKKLWQN